jgi:exoribonuclease R
MLYNINVINYKRNEFSVEPESEVIRGINLFNSRIMDGDLVVIDKHGKISVYEREGEKELLITGIIKCGQVYGKKGKNNVYLFNPYDKKYPPVLVSYKNKITFNKEIINKYARIKFIKWEEKYPMGEISEIIGDTNSLANYYEYQLYAKNLIYPQKKMGAGVGMEKELILRRFPHLELRTDRFIFSIDPEGSKDYDDALSIKVGDAGMVIISVYISNVALMIEYLDCWDVISKRISTIYLPEMRKNMLPRVLSESICSLNKDDCWKITYGIDITMDNGIINKVEWRECLLKISGHYEYESDELLKNVEYRMLCEKTGIFDSHKLVEYYMIYMNQWVAKNKMGVIYKNQVSVSANMETLDGFLEVYKKSNVSYTLEPVEYMQITSPIRRMTDLLNNMNNNVGLINERGRVWIEYWKTNMGMMNKMMKDIKKIERQANLLEYLNKTEKREYEGYKIEENVEKDKYMVYIPELKSLINGKGVMDSEMYKLEMYEIYIFVNEENEKKKIQCKIK